MSLTRFDFARRNAGFGLISTLVTVVLGFVSRSIFIAELGAAYLGVNTLMLNVVGVLSFAELGIGSAMSYSLYKPVAEGDAPLVRALSDFYKKAYRVIALIVTIVGLALLPFIPNLANEAGDLGDLRVYYTLYLLANVMSYFAVYKTGLATAEQRTYLVTNIRTVASVVLQVAQIVSLLIWGDFLIYLVVMVLARAAEQLFLNVYLSRRYRNYLQPPDAPLRQEQLEPIKRNVKALIWHKLGDVAVNQTDSIIIAAFVNVTVLGFIANYNLIINTASMLLLVIMNAAIGSFGNAIATAAPKDVYRNYKTYRFAAFWIYGMATAGMYALITPLITLWLGPDMVIPQEVALLILLNFYLLGQRATVNTVKSAAGIWDADKYLPLIQAIVNLGLSIILVQAVGLVGVFIGTLAQGLLATIVRPLIVYPRVFGSPAREYFIDGAKYLLVLVVAAVSSALAVDAWLGPITLGSMLLAILCVGLWINLIFALVFGRRPEFTELVRRLSPRKR
ncbi:lipopolysaccharide biosynthesis protein [Tessaracoccus flavus]|uniref:Uncharacterized protein n=1 Tax=Tessaracoccus flavus TaxID=1610493 RepID=A0A1Q2CI15_9ACTN|nr:oligosaccharide flippase family protein [Tessaracoccus flavus]AQP45751.1 hypothetical protein RPIT_13825 [Tessaracoccus flavus]SDZ12228.1 Membrane protein involved in the export of O-antigen and teichoic acid [Tessaracoccus flavus]